jgi:hypothetical protein
MYPRPESNRHSRKNWILNPARLPVPPLGHAHRCLDGCKFNLINITPKFISMIRPFFLFLLLFCAPLLTCGNGIIANPETIKENILEIHRIEGIEIGKKHTKKRWEAIVITLLAGPIGAHRIYLGTEAKTPILYTLTLGGLGILPLIDLGHLIFKKDFHSLENNPNIFIFQKK